MLGAMKSAVPPPTDLLAKARRAAPRKPLASGIITSLRGQLLVATKELNGGLFERAVIYMVSHDENGAMGVMLNKPMPRISFEDIVKSMNIEQMMQAGVGVLARSPLIIKGGPVDNNRGFVLHSGEYRLNSTIFVTDDISLSATSEIVTDIAKGQGPRQLNFCLGYAGWSPGQLEDELHGDGWLVAPASRNVVFDLPHADRYHAATSSIGLNSLNFSETVGQA